MFSSKSIKGLYLLFIITIGLWAHLPSKNSALLQMGKTGGESQSRTTFSNKGEWNPSETYRGDYSIQQGDTVSYGEFNGKKLWWWAKFYAKGEHFKPGFFAPQGGTSPWVLINSLSAEEKGVVAYEWRGWNGDMDKLTGLAAAVPTWRDGAVGAYSFTHDDIGAMPFDLSVQPAWDVAKDFPEIKQCWGVYVEKMDNANWEKATDMVLDGHEMFNHSMEHTSAADQWQWFFPGQRIPTHDPAIPAEIRGLTVVGSWGDPARKPVYPVKGDGTFIVESPLVAIQATQYWTQNAPSSEIPGTVLETGVTVMEPKIWLKEGVEEITLPSGQKQYVKYTKKDESGEGKNEGFIAATGPTWLELNQLDQYGGKYWKPAFAQPQEWTWDNYTTFTTGTIALYNGEYWKSLKTPAPGFAPRLKSAWEEDESWEKTTYDADNPIYSTEGEYVGEPWSSSTQYVGEDKGAPAFVTKVFCVESWRAEEYRLNIKDANDTINKYVYNTINTAGEYFRKGKKSEYYGYPFDAYSETTHDSLEAADFVGARGGAKSGVPIPGDFFHPYRIDFDAFYITKTDWDVTKSSEEYVYPENPHVLLGLNQMVDKIIDAKGYMIRELHGVCDIADGEWYDESLPSEEWAINSSAVGKGGWWGGITANQLRDHYKYVDSKIKSHDITVYTVSEVTKYRMTANAVENATIVPSGDNFLLTAVVKDSEKNLPAKYHDEISVIVSLDEAVDSLGVNYTTVDESWGSSPRRRPRKMGESGKVWSVSINPFLGSAEIVPNGEWDGQIIDKKKTTLLQEKNLEMNSVQYKGIRDKALLLSLPSGNFTVQLLSTRGRIIAQSDILSQGGLTKTSLTTTNISTGIYFLRVKGVDNNTLLVQKIAL